MLAFLPLTAARAFDNSNKTLVECVYISEHSISSGVERKLLIESAITTHHIINDHHLKINKQNILLTCSDCFGDETPAPGRQLNEMLECNVEVTMRLDGSTN